MLELDPTFQPVVIAEYWDGSVAVTVEPGKAVLVFPDNHVEPTWRYSTAYTVNSMLPCPTKQDRYDECVDLVKNIKTFY